MKRLMFGLIAFAFALGLAGCDQAQNALDAIDKAQSFKDNIEKKTKEVTDRARDLIPGNKRENRKEQGASDGEKND